MKKTLLLKTMLLLCAIVFGTSSSWADETGTINFGSAAGSTKVNAESVTGDDSQGNTWTITTAGTSSFTPNADYAQIGSSKAAATSITFTTTLANDVNITSFSAKFGGFSGTAGTVTLKVGETTVGTGSLNATNDVTVSNTSSATGKVLTVTVTGISKGVKAYYISYTYTSGPAKTITGLSYTGTPTKTTYNAGESFDPTGLTVTATFDDESADNVTTSVSWTPDPLTEGTTSVTGTYMGQTVNVSGLTVNAAPGSENNPYTVAEAIAYINTLGTSTSPNDVFVSGIISQVDEYNSSYHSITYWISDDGTTTGQMEVYSGKGLNGADFSALKDLEVGDVVTVKGKVKKYNSTPEFDKNNELVSITGRTKVNISTFTATTPTIVVGESTETTVTNDQAGWTPVSYTYESNDENVATVNANGVVTAVAKGTANITVTANVAPDDANYKAGESKSVEITVTNPFHNVIFSVNGIAGAPTSTEEGAAVTFPANPADLGGKTFMGWTETAIAGTTDEKPTFVTSATMGTSDLKYYAVYANVSGTPATLTKMASDETLSDGDKIVIVANDGTTEYGLYQNESKSKYIDKYVFDGQVETVAADEKNWVTANAEEGGLWSFGDATNGYIYNSSSNEFKIVTDSKTSFTVEFNSDNNGFTIKNGSRWFAYRADLTEENQLFRGAGNSDSPTKGSVAYFDIYKYVAGNASYAGYCTSITVPVTISDAGYATFSNASAVDFSSNTGLTVYYVSSTAGNKAEMVEIGSKKVPANTGVLLKGAAGNYSGAVTAGVDALVGNLLFACVDGYDATVDNEIYILANGTSGVGFYPIKGGTSLGAGKAYIGGGDVNAKCLTLSFGSETTAINGVEEVAPANVKTRKVVKNGRLVIETANGEFTIDGARVK